MSVKSWREAQPQDKWPLWLQPEAPPAIQQVVQRRESPGPQPPPQKGLSLLTPREPGLNGVERGEKQGCRASPVGWGLQEPAWTRPPLPPEGKPSSTTTGGAPQGRRSKAGAPLHCPRGRPRAQVRTPGSCSRGPRAAIRQPPGPPGAEGPAPAHHPDVRNRLLLA